jgi:hypothetical protein
MERPVTWIGPALVGVVPFQMYPKAGKICALSAEREKQARRLH